MKVDALEVRVDEGGADEGLTGEVVAGEVTAGEILTVVVDAEDAAVHHGVGRGHRPRLPLGEPCAQEEGRGDYGNRATDGASEKATDGHAFTSGSNAFVGAGSSLPVRVGSRYASRY